MTRIKIENRAGHRLGLLVAAAVLALIALTLPLGAGDPQPPSVIIISVDTLRADHMSGYGYDRLTSPNVDRLLRGGARFTQARTIEPLTAPALSSMVTSLFPHEHGASRNGLRMRSGLASLPKALQAQGYRTAAFVGSWTLRDKLCGLAEHFERYENVVTRRRWLGLIRSEATAEDVTELATDWVEGHRQRYSDVPFMLWVHYVEPHAPYRAQRDHLDALGLKPGGNLTIADRYDSEIAAVDHSIGNLMDGLRKLGIGDDTLIVFTSDHGESLGEHNYWGHGRHLYEPTLRIPLGIHWKGRIEPRTIEAPALILDLPPTILGILGLTQPAGFRGYDWTEVLNGAEPPADRITGYQAHKGAVISQHDSELARESGLLEVAVLRSNQKEILRVGKGRRRVFDLSNDPRELNNLGAPKETPSEGLLDWMRLVRNGLESFDDELPAPLDDESIEQLRSLGYVK